MCPSVDHPKSAVNLAELLGLFHGGDHQKLASFVSVDGRSLPHPYGKLLDHDWHMTVAVESHFESPVDVIVVRTQKDDEWYSREILLTSQADGLVVQYGIVRIRYGMLSAPVWGEIEGGAKPLGRVLIEHDVLRQVELVGLWRLKCGETLAGRFSANAGDVTYGRTARIFCDSEPAIELLEVIRPLAAGSRFR